MGGGVLAGHSIPLLAGAIILLAAAFFGIDLTLELGIAAGVPYVAVVLLARWARDKRTIIVTAVACTALVVLGFLLSPSGGEMYKVLSNRGVAIAAIWVTAIAVYSWKQWEASALHESAYVKLLQRVAEAANFEPDVESALRECLHLVCAHTGWPVGHVYFSARDESGELTPTKVWHLDESERFEAFREVTERTRFAPGIGLPGRVLSSRKPVWIEDVTKDPNFPRAHLANNIGVKAAFAFPVLVGSEVAAVLEFFAAEAMQPDERMLEVMGQIGTHLGRVIERASAAEAARESGEKYRHIFQSAPVSIWEEDHSAARAALDALRAEGVTDIEAYLDEHPDFVREVAGMIRVVDVNDAALEMTGIEDKQLLLGGLGRIYDPAAHDVLKAELVAIAAGRTRFETESRNRNARGERLDTHVSLAIPAQDSDFLNLLVCVSDITDRKRAEEDRLALEQRIQHTQRLESLGVLAGGIAHDFNNLLAVILGNTRLALEELPADFPLRQLLTTAHSAGQHAAGLTRQMLTYAGGGSATREAVDLSRLVEDMLDLLHTVVDGECTLKTELKADLPEIAADPVQLRQMILNLVTNAREALPGPGGSVTVRTGELSAGLSDFLDAVGSAGLPSGQYVTLEVSDTGIGIDHETQQRLFDPFFTTKFPGRGLGLAALLGIVRAHGGAIKIESEPGAGATFRLILPCAPVVEPLAVPSPGDEPGAARTVCILVVDDDEDMLALVKAFLDKSGFESILALGGRAALDAFRSRSGEIDGVLLDWAMPDLSGEETLLELRKIGASIPVILMSGFSEEKAVARLARGELAGFLHKPFEPEELAAAVSAAVGSGSPTTSASARPRG